MYLVLFPSSNIYAVTEHSLFSLSAYRLGRDDIHSYQHDIHSRHLLRCISHVQLRFRDHRRFTAVYGWTRHGGYVQLDSAFSHVLKESGRLNYLIWVIVKD